MDIVDSYGAMAEFGSKKPKVKCPRCHSKRVIRRLDGGKLCGRCGQRIAKDGRLIPSADRRGKDKETDTQMQLL